MQHTDQTNSNPMKIATPFAPETPLVAARDQVSCELGDETVVLNVKTGIYFGLDAVGTAVWKAIQQPATPAQLVEAVLAEFDVSRPTCEADVQELLAELRGHGLVEVYASPAPSA